MIKKRAKNFIDNADIGFSAEKKQAEIIIKSNKHETKKYLFSIGETISETIDHISLKSRTIRTTRTDIVKIGILLADKLSIKELETLISEL